MEVRPIAYSYWRSIKRYKRTFASISEELKNDVLYLAKSDVANGVITAEQFKYYIGMDYTA